jgi:predicted RNA binding protein YcfA (HicA-like mRNA interferase family)
MLARKFFWMPKLPVVSGEGVVKVLSKQGFTAIRGKGDHVV